MRVLAPIDGEVIEIYAREGERVGPEGLVELGRTHEICSRNASVAPIERRRSSATALVPIGPEACSLRTEVWSMVLRAPSLRRVP
jgi:hypothetical protein